MVDLASALLCWRQWYGRALLRLRKERHAEVQRVHELQDEGQILEPTECSILVRLQLRVAALARNRNIWLDVSGNSCTKVGNAISAYDCVAEV